MESVILIGIVAGTLTSICFIPQIIKGYQTKKLTDVSYLMCLVLIVGMFLWLVYGVLKNDWVLIGANIVGITTCALLIIMKKIYTKSV